MNANPNRLNLRFNPIETSVEIPTGLLLLDKPAGVTSFGCVNNVRRRIGAKRVGHCGTLDPAARGLLMILVGTATRTQETFLGLEKEYWFRAELGLKTSTADLEGEVLERKPFDHVKVQNLTEALKSFVGETAQMPPMFSALKYKGKPYYHYARKGVAIPRVPRIVSIRSFTLESFSSPYWEGRVVCSRGTYVRTLIEDVAERLGTCSTLVELVRDRVGPYKREHALGWEELRRMQGAELKPLLRPVLKESVLVPA